jgi:hypothetical protein
VLSMETDPSAVTISMPDTAVARLPFASPDPCVPVAHEPAIEICGSEARFCNAQPAEFRYEASSAYRIPALTVTQECPESISMIRGRPATEMRSPAVSAMRLNE